MINEISLETDTEEILFKVLQNIKMNLNFILSVVVAIGIFLKKLDTVKYSLSGVLSYGFGKCMKLYIDQHSHETEYF